MKNITFKSFILSSFFALIAIFSSSNIFAQSNPFSVEIPFNFQVGNEKVTAGKYELSRISPTSFLLRNESGSVKVLMQTPLTLEAEKSGTVEKLVFNQYGKKYFLRQIYAIRNGVGRALFESKNERDIRQGKEDEFEANKVKPEKVEVALKIK